MPLTEDVVIRRRVSVRAEATEERRRQIIAAATEAFATTGYNGTSLRDVAARAGISHTGLLHHFPDKPGLLEAVLDHHVEDAAADFQLESADGETVMRALVQIAERDVREPVHLRLMMIVTAEALSPEHPAHGWSRLWYARVRSRLTAAFTDLERKGRYRGRPVPPEQAALQVSGMRDGATLQWLLAPDEIDLVETIRSQILVYADISI